MRALRGLLDYRKSLKEQLGTLNKRVSLKHLYSDEQASVYSDAVVHYEGLLACIEADLTAVRSLLPKTARESQPTLTNLVDGGLAAATEPRVGPGTYSQLCEIVHPGAYATKQLVNSGSTTGFLNVSLSSWVWPLLATGWLMEHCLIRRAEYYSLPSPEPHVQPVLEALYRASGLPHDTLLLEPSPDLRN